MKKMKNLNVLFISLVTLLGTSCIPLKNYVYLQESDAALANATFSGPEQYKVQPNDNLYIQVLTDNPEISAFFNITSTDRYLNNESAIELGSYRVSDEGDIDFPIIGKMHVAGKSTEEIKKQVVTAIAVQVERPSVVVKLVNRNFTVLGEVNGPGTYSFFKDRITMLEAIGYARDLTDFGDRKKVKLVRHHGTEKKVVTIDLTSAEFLTSEYYYVLPNDVIYVEPTNRVYGAKTLPFATILTTINTVVLLYNAAK
jgi:polysaccharide biosynthesis/export protein